MIASPVAVAHSTAPLWEALLNDTDTPVYLVDLRGRVEHANMAARDLFGFDTSMSDASLSSSLPEAVAAEQLRFIRQAAESNGAVAVDAVLRGKWVRLTMRSVEDLDQQRVLVVGTVGHPATVSEGVTCVRAKHDDHGVLGTLTPRELEILRLIALGLSTNDIAKVLFRSVKTVEGHRVSLGSKLNATNRVELARIALRCGLITLETPVPVISEGDSD